MGDKKVRGKIHCICWSDLQHAGLFDMSAIYMHLYLFIFKFIEHYNFNRTKFV